MDDKKNKPLRPVTSDKARDIQSAYFKDKGSRDIPITSSDDNYEKNEAANFSDESLNDNQNDEESIANTDNNGSIDESISEEEKLYKAAESENELHDNIKLMEKEIEDLKDQVIRKTADLDNMRRRTLKEKNDLIIYANEGLLIKILPLIDDITNAIEAGKKSQDYNSLLQGIDMIFQKTLKTFSDVGVKKMEIKTNDIFDVNFHEGILQMPSPEVAEGNIIQVAQEGYMLYDKVLRHAKVITSSGKPE